jgi:hypothetical protein
MKLLTRTGTECTHTSGPSLRHAPIAARSVAADEVLGVHVVAENAGEVIYAGLRAVRFHLTIRDLVEIPRPVLWRTAADQASRVGSYARNPEHARSRATSSMGGTILSRRGELAARLQLLLATVARRRL